MNTPICDFVAKYADKNALRLHMPGHKGASFLGYESYDITEISGADSLYEASGIIAESEKNASELFGCPTYYSTEGSSHCIRAMLFLASLYAKERGKRPHIAAARNAHKVFLSAAAMLDFDLTWLYPEQCETYLSCVLSADETDRFLHERGDKITALYLTSPDYLGNITELKKISEICHRHGVLLLVDNAHGAYLKFLQESQHPIDMGADLCCDSAHKTLPVLTGGAYLHVSPSLAETFGNNVKTALSLFGSTSPSYLILQSLDCANKYISEGYPERLDEFCREVERQRKVLCGHGFVFSGNEPLKLTIKTKEYGYLGTELAKILEEKNIVCEFADSDYLVLMLTPEISSEGLRKMSEALLSVPKKEPVKKAPPLFKKPKRVMPIREALFSPCERISVSHSVGRVLASPSVGCPPAVPIVVCGEKIDESAAKCFEYYGIEEVYVVK